MYLINDCLFDSVWDRHLVVDKHNAVSDGERFPVTVYMFTQRPASLLVFQFHAFSHFSENRVVSRLVSAATRVSLKMLLIWFSVTMSTPVLSIGETKGVDVLGTGSVNDRTIGFDLRNPLRFTLLPTKFESTDLFKSGELCDIIGQLI